MLPKLQHPEMQMVPALGVPSFSYSGGWYGYTLRFEAKAAQAHQLTTRPRRSTTHQRTQLKRSLEEFCHRILMKPQGVLGRTGTTRFYVPIEPRPFLAAVGFKALRPVDDQAALSLDSHVRPPIVMSSCRSRTSGPYFSVFWGLHDLKHRI